jgi:peptidoglycan/LPS O-acetylase OafA/YrhL
LIAQVETTFPPSPHAAYRERRVFGSLDGLRGLSIAAVVWHHTNDGSVSAYLPGARLGFLGVDLFFVLSGFLIVTLLLRERDRSGAISLRDFYARRALRIFPLYYGVLLAFTVLYWSRVDPRAETFRSDLPYLALYLSNWIATPSLAIAWSLAAEEQFYLLWPPVERWLRRCAVPLIVAFISVSELIQLGWLDPLLARAFGWTPEEPRMLRETSFAPICFGVLLAHVLHRRASFERVAALWSHPLAAPLALLALLAIPQLFPGDIRGWPRLLAQLLMLNVLASAVVREDHALARFYAWRPLARLGAVSYGVYLLHHIGIGVAERASALVSPSIWELPLAPFILGGLCAFALAELSFRYYEQPFLKLKRRWGGS